MQAFLPEQIAMLRGRLCELRLSVTHGSLRSNRPSFKIDNVLSMAFLPTPEEGGQYAGTHGTPPQSTPTSTGTSHDGEAITDAALDDSTRKGVFHSDFPNHTTHRYFCGRITETKLYASTRASCHSARDAHTITSSSGIVHPEPPLPSPISTCIPYSTSMQTPDSTPTTEKWVRSLQD
uniref:Uncharacterized protein n=1 Tax=Arundo donax TaxID=35708 RepID=A0A0A8YUI7_ARUDO